MLIFLYGVLGFIILVFVHELGHFLVARMFGISVEEFAVGMGPTIVQKQWKGTLYKLCVIPLGGYCKIKGQEDFASIDRNEDKDSFFGKSPWVRFLVVLAGPVFSFVLGFILISFTFFEKGESHLKYTFIDPPSSSKFFKTMDKILTVNGKKVTYWDDIHTALIQNIGDPNTLTLERKGKIKTIKNYLFNPSEQGNKSEYNFQFYYRTGPTIIAGILKNSLADKSGLKFGDKIVSVNNILVRTDENFEEALQKSPNNKIKIVIDRYPNVKELAKKDPLFFNNSKNAFTQLTLFIPAERHKANGKVVVAGLQSLITYPGKDIINNWEHHNLSFFQSFHLGWTKSISMFNLNAKAIKKLLEGNKIIFDGLSGPIKIFYSVGKISENNGFVIFLSIIGSISLALAFFNILPLPALDGGHMLISFIEGITRKQVPAKLLNTIQTIGIVMLLSLFVFVSIRDIKNLFL